MSTLLKRATVALVFLAAAATAAVAGNQQDVSAGLTLAGAPLAIHGYDPVAFHTEGEARLGSAKFAAVHDGAAFRFVSEANQKLFEKNPQKYAPAFGGYCAYGVALGAKFDGDPRVFEIVDGTLYFNLDPDIQKKWSEDIPGNVKKAEANWKKIRDTAPADLK
jgi:hypothetical protein